MEAKKNNNSIRNFEIKINNNEYTLNLGIKEEDKKLFILIKSKEIFKHEFFQFESTYENLIKLNKCFNGFESLEEIEEEFNSMIYEKKYSISLENEEKNIKIILDFNFGKKTKKVELLLEKAEISIDTIIKQNEKIKEQELKIKKLESQL